MTGHASLGPGREFDAIRALLAQWGNRARGVGDDCALLDTRPGERLVVSVDTSVENVHVRREWLTPEEIGWRATMAALSDPAAMGARPLGLLAALAVPVGWRGDILALGAGIGAAAHAAQCPLVGGDLDAGQALSIAVTVLGSAASPLLRSGARAGDALWVTGTLGGPAAALRAWHAGNEPPPAARTRFARPVARLDLAASLAARGCHAAIDISDGLIADARHLAAASGMALTIALEAIPVFGGSSPVDAAASGEEYELLFAAPPSFDALRIATEFGVPVARIGDVAAGPAGVTVTSGGARVEFDGGHDHFSR